MPKKTNNNPNPTITTQANATRTRKKDDTGKWNMSVATKKICKEVVIDCRNVSIVRIKQKIDHSSVSSSSSSHSNGDGRKEQ